MPYTVLHNHTSPDSAYVVDDYPYGFRLRCKIRYWIETREGYGQRFMSQTSNPKHNDSWNKPKGGTYTTFLLMVLDDQNHCVPYGFHYPSPEDFYKCRADKVYPQLDHNEKVRFDTLERLSRLRAADSWRKFDAALELVKLNGFGKEKYPEIYRDTYNLIERYLQTC